MENKWYVIINPNAGSRKGEQDWPAIRDLLISRGLKFEYTFSEYHKHAISLASRAIENGYRHLLAVGGDGTINEIVNGIFKQAVVSTTDIILGVLTIGTGNDWGRMFDIPMDYEKAIDIISAEKVFYQDVGLVQYKNGSGSDYRYFINIAGIGFDAIVAKKTNSLKALGKSNSFSYLTSLFSSLLKYKHHKSEIIVDESKHKLNTSLFSMNVGICQYNGGGMKQVPNAIPDDGLFDLTIISKVRKFSVFRHLQKIYRGTHLSLPYVKSFQAKTVIITSNSPINLEVDGESLGHTPMEFSIIPSGIKVITG
ncbi:MAG: diacylglycerol kinase family lipid kinase [Bacteroidales bacterium]|nr:diacylglycerol kinase family lipid kinase [Bacteroidales bacterium]MCF8326650.1 diacylglycerol kinase family lipid kinase [Bacteroidales bacterium]